VTTLQIGRKNNDKLRVQRSKLKTESGSAFYESSCSFELLTLNTKFLSLGFLVFCMRINKVNINRTQHGKHSGLTLLELILVMVILSTVLAMAAPSLRGFFTSRQTQDAAAQILALTQLARSQAVSEGIIYRLNFDVEAGTYWLTAQKAGAFEKLKTEFGQVFNLPKDTTLELQGLEQDGGNTFVAFTPQGTITTGTIRLIDRRGQAVEVTCAAATESFSINVIEQNNDNHTRR